MKKILIVGLCAGLFFASCINDKGNYDYVSPNQVLPVEIICFYNEANVLQGDTIELVQGERLQLTPEILNDDPERYTYSWFTTDAISNGTLPTKTVLGNQKDLDATIMLVPKDYYLNFKILDAKRDVYKYKQVRLKVNATNINTGWYVLKDKNNATDFDYIKDAQTRIDNVLGTAGYSMSGEARMMVHLPERYYHPGITGTLKAIQVLSSEDMQTYNEADITKIKTFVDQFYFSYACNPQYLTRINSSSDCFFINDGKLYSIYGMMQNVGKFSPKIGVNGVDYSLYPVAIPYGSSNVLVFDTLSRSFYKASATGGSLAVCTDEDVSVNGTTATISYSNYTMIRMFEFGLYDSNVRQGFALMRDSGDTYCLAQIVLGTQNAFRSLNTIEDNAQLLTSTVMAAPKTGNFVYFAIDNKVYCYEIAPGLSLVDKERLLMTLSDNDPITYMAYFNVDNNGNECYLAMLTNPTQGWKLHIYPVVNPGNPTLTNSPTIYTGEGTGRYVMHRKI